MKNNSTHANYSGRVYAINALGNSAYTVTRFNPAGDNPTYVTNAKTGLCTCPAAAYRHGECKHVKMVRDIFNPPAVVDIQAIKASHAEYISEAEQDAWGFNEAELVGAKY